MARQVFLIISICAVIALSSLSTPTNAKAYSNGEVTFSWRPNPPQENVVSYRLYYGSESRYNSNGTLKSNFSYQYYIDVAESLRCDAETDASCEPLHIDELSCNLDAASPRCTLSSLSGTLYFSLTACSSSAESNLTQELRAVPASSINLLAIHSLLLKNN